MKEGPNFYPTPAWATHALMLNEKFEGGVWEPACGKGDMSEIIKKYVPYVYSSDLLDYGYCHCNEHDFLGLNKMGISENARPKNIITNPPYNLAEEFIKEALFYKSEKAAFLLRLAFLESASRANGLFKHHPPSRIWVFSERITFYPGGLQTAGSGTLAHGWFIWDKNHKGPTTLHWLSPGLKKKFK